MAAKMWGWSSRRSIGLALSLTLSAAPFFPCGAAEDDSVSAATTPALTAPAAAPVAGAGNSLEASASFKQAASLMVEGNYLEAEAAFQKTIASQPDNFEAHAGLGMALGRQYKLDQADEQFDKVLALQPNHPVAHCGKAMVLLYRVEKNELGTMTRAQALKVAGRECNKALDADSRVVEAHYLLGTVFREEGRLDLAIQAFQGAIKLDPHYLRAYNVLASTQAQKGNLSEAVENYKLAIVIQPRSATAHTGLADVYVKQGKWSEAIAELRTVITNNPKNLNGRLALAQLLETRGDPTSSLNEYEELKALKPEDAQVYMAIARISDAQGEQEKSLAVLKEALKVVPRNFSVHLLTANAYLRMGKLDDAMHEYQTVLTMDSLNSSAWRGGATAYYARILRSSPSILALNPEFVSTSQRVTALLKNNSTNQALQLMNLILRAIAGGTADLPPNTELKSLDDKLLHSILLLIQTRYTDAGLALASATNSSTTADDVAVAADTCYVLRQLDSADGAYRRLAIFAGSDRRAQIGLAAVAALRNDATANLNAGNAMLASKQFKQAVERLRTSALANPLVASTHSGLAEALEKNAASVEQPLINLREAVFHYQSFIALSPGLQSKEQDKLRKRIERLEDAIAEIEHNPGGGGIRSLLERLSVR